MSIDIIPITWFYKKAVIIIESANMASYAFLYKNALFTKFALRSIL